MFDDSNQNTRSQDSNAAIIKLIVCVLVITGLAFCGFAGWYSQFDEIQNPALRSAASSVLAGYYWSDIFPSRDLWVENMGRSKPILAISSISDRACFFRIIIVNTLIGEPINAERGEYFDEIAEGDAAALRDELIRFKSSKSYLDLPAKKRLEICAWIKQYSAEADSPQR